MPSKKILKNIFLSSIQQNAGKTTISLGLFKALKDRKFKTSFIKPVGQKVVSVGKYDIDKDSYLIREVFRYGGNPRDMSPVTIGRGFTEKYIFNPRRTTIEKKIVDAFGRLSKRKDAIIVEGTGHAGVGSVIDFSNADVAHLLGSKVIIISGGGIGKSIDEILLNKALFDLKHVEILGVIVNKVLPEKYAKVKKAVKQGLKNKGIKLLGVIPMQPMLSSPTVGQVRELLSLTLVSGKENLNRRIKHAIVAAMEPHNMIHFLKDGTLVLTSGDRVDNILVAVSSHLVEQGEKTTISGIILTGGLQPNPKIIDLLKKSRIPVLVTQDDTYSIAAKIQHLLIKIQKTDTDKIEEATKLVNQYVDIDAILKNFS